MNTVKYAGFVTVIIHQHWDWIDGVKQPPKKEAK